MLEHFWVGFEKRADLGRTLSNVARKIRNKPVPVAHTIDYSGTAFTKRAPKVLDAAGKDLGAPKAVPPPPPKDVHQAAAEELARRRKSLHQGQHAHTDVQEALSEKPKSSL